QGPRLGAWERHEGHRERDYAPWGAECSAGCVVAAADVLEVGATAGLAASVFCCSSSLISSSSVLFSSFDARLNSARLLPSERPNSGSFRGPKIIRAITKMMISSGMPMEPNICVLLSRKLGQSLVDYRNGRAQRSRKSGPSDGQKSLPTRKLSVSIS